MIAGLMTHYRKCKANKRHLLFFKSEVAVAAGAERCAEHKGKPGDGERHDHPSALSSQLSTEQNQRTKASQSFN